MSNPFREDMSLEEKIDLLKTNAEVVQETDYIRELSPEELQDRKHELSETMISHAQLKDELDEYKAQYKAKMDPLKEHCSALLEEIKFKKARVHGTTYQVANHEAGMMETWDENAILLETRRLKPEEKQARLFIQKG